MVFTAPAKINLYLKVIQQRDDGYHEIETLFERISLFDRISIETDQDHTTITCDEPRVPTGEGSLLSRAVEVFRKRLKRDLNFRIVLEKNIPVAAGLGGGSSDTAALLKGLNRISGFPLGKQELLDISRDLGADIPFFIDDCRFAFGKGRGDIIQKVDTSLDIWHVLVTPPFEVSTRDVYGKAPAFNLTSDRGVDRMFTAFLSGNNVNALANNLCNDLQAIVLRDFPVLEEVFLKLRKAGAKGVLLSGSGPTVFGIFDHKRVMNAADSLRLTFPKRGNWRVYVARTC
jgi:4-diphosphocytidyl-2-C-methyl-D-erythritol kinase